MNTDVLIIGGGAAGCMAAIGAKEKGDVDVLILEKAYVPRSGDAGAGNDHLLAHLNTVEDWDFTDGINHEICRLGGSNVLEEMVITIDLGDIRTRYASKMEYLCIIRDARERESWGFLSENDQLFRAMDVVSRYIASRWIWGIRLGKG